MSALFWQRMHGGTTHLPIVLLLASVIFDACAWQTRDAGLRRGLHLAGFGAAVAGVLGGVGAVVSGLAMSRGEILGHGLERSHHLLVWPGFVLCAVAVAGRVFKRGQLAARSWVIYLGGMSAASALMLGAGYFGGEMLLNAETSTAVASVAPAENAVALIEKGHRLFLANCAHCHAADATGDEGPDLHALKKSDARLAALIANGVAGEMPKFSAKLTAPDIQALLAFLHSLR